jgi:hypothetical protein
VKEHTNNSATEENFDQRMNTTGISAICNNKNGRERFKRRKILLKKNIFGVCKYMS